MPMMAPVATSAPPHWMPIRAEGGRQRVAHVDQLVGDDPRQDEGHRDIEDDDDAQAEHEPEGDVLLRVLGLLGRRGDGVEADVGEEDDGRAGHDALPAEGHHGLEVGQADVAGAEEDEEEDDGDLDAGR